MRDTIVRERRCTWAIRRRRVGACGSGSGKRCLRTPRDTRLRSIARCIDWTARGWTGSRSKCRPILPNGQACATVFVKRHSDTITAMLTMKRVTLLSLLLAAVPAAFAQDGFIQLFNGKDFTGWKIGGAQDTFKIKDGAIVANGAVAHAFYDGPVNNHDFKNFELMVDVMTQPNSNGGIYFHTEFQESGFPKKGFEVQVNNTHRDPIKSGSLYHVKDIGADITG